MSDVFISYSRKERVFADKLASELEKDGRTVWIDRARIELTSEWWEEIKRGIEASDNFVLIMSPDSMASPVCHLEIEYARKLTKRIIPVYHIAHDYEGTKTHFGDRLYKNDRDGFLLKLYGNRNPMLLFEENWKIIPGINRIEAPIMAIERDEQYIPTGIDEAGFQTFFPSLQKAIDTDIEHVHQHTYLFNRTRDWLKKGQKTSDLLNDVETREAEEWLQNWDDDKADREARGLPIKNPQPNDDIRVYIAASREAETERIRRLEELEESRRRSEESARLAQKEANTSDRARKRARQTLLGVAVLSVVLIIATLIFTSNQVNTAQDQAILAATQAADAEQREAQAVTAVADANTQLTSVPPALTQANQQVITAQEQADLAGTQVADANSALTAVPPTLTQVNQQVIVAQGQVNLAGTQVADANSALANVVPTLTQVAALVQQGEARIDSLRLASAAARILSEPDGNAEVAALLSIRAINNIYTQQADATLVEALERLQSLEIFGQATGIRILTVALTTDNQYAITGGQDDKIHVWDTQTGQVERVLEGHTRDIASLAVSPDSRYILSGSYDRTARLWDFASGREIAVLDLEGYIITVAFSPDNTQMLTGDNLGNVIMWDVETRQQEQKFQYSAGYRTDSMYFEARFSPNGNYIITFHESIMLWNAKTGAFVQNYPGADALDILYDGGPEIMMIDSGGKVQVFNRADGFEREMIIINETNVAAFSPDGSTYALGDWNGNIYLYSTEDQRLIGILTGHGSPILTDAGITDLVFSQDGHFLLSGSQDGTARLWRVGSENPNELFQTVNLSAYAFSHDGQVLAVGDYESFSVIDTPTSAIEYSKPIGAVGAILFSPDDHYLGVASVNDESFDAIVFDAKTGRQLHLLQGHSNPVSILAFSHDSRWMLTASFVSHDNQPLDTTIGVWDMETGELVHRLETGNPVYTAAFSEDDSLIYTNYDRVMRAWNIETGQVVQDLPFVAANFSQDGRYAITRNNDFSVSLIEIATSQELMSFIGHTDSVFSAQVSSDLKYLLTGSNDSTYRIWDISTGHELRRIEIAGGEIAFLPPDNNFFAVHEIMDAGLARLRLWETDYNDLIEKACERVFRDFSADERVQYGILDSTPTCPQFASN